YFDAKEDAERLVVIRTSFWFTMAMSTLGLALGVVFAAPIGHWLGLGHDPSLVRAGAVGLWAQTNYQQLTALFRVEERSTQYAIASVANVLITVAAMVLFVAYFHWGAVGLVVGNFTGTLLVYGVLLAYRYEQLGAQFDTQLFRKMQHFGMPLVPSALAPWWVRLLTDPRYQRAEKGVALLAFAGAVYAGYVVLAIGSGRARKTQLNWVVTGVGAAVNVALNFWLVPRWGMVGAAVSTAI